MDRVPREDRRPPTVIKNYKEPNMYVVRLEREVTVYHNKIDVQRDRLKKRRTFL